MHRRTVLQSAMAALAGAALPFKNLFPAPLRDFGHALADVPLVVQPGHVARAGFLAGSQELCIAVPYNALHYVPGAVWRGYEWTVTPRAIFEHVENDKIVYRDTGLDRHQLTSRDLRLMPWKILYSEACRE